MSNYYFLSKNVKVFPCSFRGTYTDANANKVFDPEARKNSEYNLTHLGNINGDNSNYVVDYTNKLLKVVVNGYYFEIDDLDLTNSTFKTAIGFNTYSQWSLKIKTKSVTLKAKDDRDNSRTTLILDSLAQGKNLDDKVSAGDSEFTFFGLALSDDITGSSASLKLLVKDNDSLKIAGEAKLPIISRGTNPDAAGSIVIGGQADGHTNLATGKDSFATGNNTKATGNYSSSFGQGTTADKENLMVAGKYNETSDNDLFIVGNGEDASHKSNVLQVNRDKVVINKQTDVTGNTTINGTEILSGDLNINSGKFKVTAETGKVEATGNLEINTNKFKVDASNGNTTIAGTLTQGNTTDKQQVTFNGNVDAKAGLDITGDETVSGTLSVTGTTTLGSTLGVTGDTTIGGTFTVGAEGATKDTTLYGSTTVKSSLAVGQSTTGSETLKVGGTAKITSNTTIDGTLTTSATDQQVEFNGNVDAKNGLDVSGAGLTVTAGNVLIDSSGNFESKKLITLGVDQDDVTGDNARSAVKIGKAGATTEVLGNLKASAGTLTLPEIPSAVNEDKILFGNKNFKTTLLDLLYPVGSIYTSTSLGTDNKCPIKNTLGGTWERIKDTFLWAAGDNDTIGATGGSKDAIVVKHTHDAECNDSLSHSHRITGTTNIPEQTKQAVAKELTGDLAFRQMADGNKIARTATGVFSDTGVEDDQNSTGYERTKQGPTKIHFDGTHSHTISSDGIHKHDITMSDTGEYGTGKNMPPYLVVYMWKRTA